MGPRTRIEKRSTSNGAQSSPSGSSPTPTPPSSSKSSTSTPRSSSSFAPSSSEVLPRGSSRSAAVSLRRSLPWPSRGLLKREGTHPTLPSLTLRESNGILPRGVILIPLRDRYGGTLLLRVSSTSSRYAGRSVLTTRPSQLIRLERSDFDPVDEASALLLCSSVADTLQTIGLAQLHRYAPPLSL